MRVIVVGGGILGLAAARLIALEQESIDVVLLEKESGPALHQTGRNSGVVHAGLYYKPGSLKARLCRRGVALLHDFCTANDLPYVECGKVLIATTENELPRLDAIRRLAESNGVPGVTMLDGAGLRRVEPHAVGVAALHSPTTAIVDFGAVAHALAAQMVENGGVIHYRSEVTRVVENEAGASVHLANGELLNADRVLVCAGLHVDRLARASGEPSAPRIIPFRGEYWALRAERRHLVRGLIYPVPDPALPFLGVHLTSKVDGQVLIGPNAVLAMAREGYRGRDVSPRDLSDTLSWPGMWRLAARHRRAAACEIARSVSKRVFVREARRYVPELESRDVIRAPAGVRAQAVDRSGDLVDDFRLTGEGKVVWVRNAPSPAATSSLAIAEALVERLEIGWEARDGQVHPGGI